VPCARLDGHGTQAWVLVSFGGQRSGDASVVYRTQIMLSPTYTNSVYMFSMFKNVGSVSCVCRC